MTRVVKLAILALFLPNAAMAIPQCPTDEHRETLSRFEEKLIGAADVDEARAMALKKVGHSKTAIDRAAAIVPGDTELIAHQEALADFTADVESAETKEAVAAEFADLRDYSHTARCYYSTGEVIAVVIGFILGILPGIILLILLC